MERSGPTWYLGGVFAHVSPCAVFVPWTSKDSEAGVLVGHASPSACVHTCAGLTKLSMLVTLRGCTCLLLFLSLKPVCLGKSKWAQGGWWSCVWVLGIRGPQLVR